MRDIFGLEAEVDEEAYDETLDADLEEEDFAEEDVAPEGTKTTYEKLGVSAISTFILYQQNMLRNKKGQVDGILNFQELSISDPDGNPIWLSEDFFAANIFITLFFCKQKWRMQLKKIFESGIGFANQSFSGCTRDPRIAQRWIFRAPVS